jgi:hypothetical protein
VLRQDPAQQESTDQAAGMLGALGYRLYHLVPEFEVVVPMDSCFIDGFTLNLVACRAEQAADRRIAGCWCSRMRWQPRGPGSETRRQTHSRETGPTIARGSRPGSPAPMQRRGGSPRRSAW